MRCWQDPGAAETLFLGPFGYFSTELTSRIVFPCQGRLHYGCIDTESNRGDGFNASHISLGVKPATSSRPVQLRQSDCPGLHKNVFGAQTQPGSLTIVPERWDSAEVPSREEKNPRQLCVPMHILAQGLGHSQDGAVRVGSSQEKPACRRASPVSSCLTPDSTNHTVQRAGLPRIGETAGFGRPTNDMVSVEASACTL